MKIERIDEKTVKCFLSNEELAEYDIDYKDFVLRSDKAKEMLKEIIEHAESEVGYKAPQFAFDLQIMMVPDQGMVLTFSEKEPFEGRDGEQILEYLKEMKSVLERTREKLAKKGDNLPTANLGQTEAEKNNTPQIKRPDFAIFQFSNLREVIRYALSLPANLRVQAELYKMEGYYYLHLMKGAASYERYSKACVQALEFAGLYSAESKSVMLLKEHGECLIADKTLKKLRSIQ